MAPKGARSEAKKARERVERMNKKEARSRARELREEIAHHDRLYYVENEPEISDAAYDALKAELEAIEESYPDLVSENSPTQRVGAEPREELGTIRHESPMLSLEAVDHEEELARFLDTCRDELGSEEVSLVGEPKYDGLSVELVYEQGRLEAASTRGDGERGEDVTDNVRTIGQIPLRLDPSEGVSVPRHLVVRGEVLMTRSALDELNEERQERGERTFANPRNAAAGALRQLDPAVTADRPLEVFFWEIAPSSSGRPRTQWESLELLSKLGLRVNDKRRRVDDVEDARALYDELLEERDELDYEIDGTVFKVDELAAHEALGARAASPRWALAWKFPSRRRVTRIEEIEVQVGRTGALTPVAKLEPVHIGGVEVRHVSLHNQDEIERKDIRIGDRVLVERAGDVIPHVIEVEKSKRSGHEERFHLPKKCPVCGGETARIEDEAVRRCTNVSCPAQRKQAILHFGSKEALDIEGLGEKLVDQLVDAELAEDFADLFDLKTKELTKLERMAHKSAENLVRAIEESREKATLPELIYGLGIPHVGRATASDLAREFRSLDALMSAEREELEELAGVGGQLASAIEAWCDNEGNQRLVRRLKKRGLDPKGPKKGKGRLEGKKIAITGSLDSMTRSEAKEQVRLEGGRATSSVSGETDYLVVGEDPGENKTSEAELEGVEQIGEDELLEMLGRRNDG